MTWYVSFRSDPVGGSVVDPLLLEGGPAGLRPVSLQQFSVEATGRNLLFVVHGFNVSQRVAVQQYATLEAELALPPNAIVLGVLWPGDFFIPVVNYPFEASDAWNCGRRLARLCNQALTGAASLSFMSHSLGGRLVLEAVKGLTNGARSVCLTAAAVDRDVLTRQYTASLANSESVAVLSSVRDQVLQYAYPAGDLLSDLFGDGDSPFRSALGRRGPRPGAGPTVTDSRIPKDLDYDHKDYMPSGDGWQKVAAYARNCFLGLQQSWP